MAFQDFDHISEMRRLERKRKFRRRILIGSISVIACVVLIVAGVLAVVNNNEKENEHKSAAPTHAQQQPTKQISHPQAVIKQVCDAATYKETCRSTLEKAIDKNPLANKPKDLLKLAIEAANDEIEMVLTKISSFQFNSPQDKAAFEDCKELIENAKEELNASISQAGYDVDKLVKNAPDMNNWLSAVMSYQETCIDGFPNGTLKTNMERAFNASKELTSNSLAISSTVTNLLSTFNLKGGSRRLLAEESKSPSLDKDGYPSWMSREDRRMLKGANTDKPTPNVVVAKDGSGQFTTISAALAAMPPKYDGRYIIYVKAGIYDETVLVTKKMENLTIYGDGSQKTVVTGNKNFAAGVQTFRTATFAVEGDGFMAQAMGFRNTAGPEGHQAVAIRVQSDRSIFLNCRFEAYQDTLYAQTHRQFYRSCVISGTIDFIFGDAAAVFQNCLITVRKPMDNQQNIVTAQGRIDPHETTGIVLQNCRIEPDESMVPVKATIRSYLGRPWKEYSRTIIMESTIEDFIHPDGFLPWLGDFGLKTLYYAEFNNKGPGSKTADRVKWPGHHIIDGQEALKYTVEPFLQGDWITASGSPVRMGLFN